MSVIDVLKPHNQEAFQEICEKIESGITRIVAPRATGSGKTYLMGALAERYNDEKKLVLEPTRPLLDGIKDKFDEFGIKSTDFITYQKLIRMSDEDIAEMDYKLIFLDECHHGTAPVWGRKIDCLMTSHSDAIVFGTSATTVRNDGVNVTESIFEGNAVSELPLSKAIARKVLPCPHYITAIYRLDDELDKLKKKVENSTNTKAEKKEFFKKIHMMKTQLDKSYGIPTILNKYIKVRDGKYLVFCQDKKHLNTMRDVVIDWFRVAGIKNIHSYSVYSDYPDKEKDYKDFCENNSESLKLMFVINMLNEGIHVKDISGVLMLRTTLSNTIYLQQLGRLVEAENIGKYLLVFDFVNNFSSVNDGIGLLKEIKDAIAEEKESDPDFDDSGFEDIDTYFVIDQILEVQEMFREIEGRLQDNWDLYIKALKQYKEREGDCDVLRNHIEVVNDVNVSLGMWCKSLRATKNNTRNSILPQDKEEKLNKIEFIWDVTKYRFENNVKAIAEYYKKHEKYPSRIDDDFKVRKLGGFISSEKEKMRNMEYPGWKIEIIKKYLPDFTYETPREEAFNKFIYYAHLYKNRYGHINIKYYDVIDGYHIGYSLVKIRRILNNKKLSKNNVIQLNELGIYMGNKTQMLNQMTFEENMKLSRIAVDNGIIINNKNQIFREKNLYCWIQQTIKRKYKKDELSDEQIETIEKLIGKPLCKYGRGNYISIIDITGNKKIAICKSQCEAINILQNVLNEKLSFNVVYNRLTGKVTSPYKGRFMFYYATDEEIKKYFKNDKTS